MIKRAVSRRVACLATTALLVIAACDAGSSAPRPAAAPLIAAAGDIACEPGAVVTPTTCQQQATSDLLMRRPLAAVLTLGDEQYVEGRLPAFRKSYAPTWGRRLSITHPAPGNHEHLSGANGFYAYFGKAAGSPSHPYYSFDIGAWHVVALDSDCAAAGCAKGSPQERWLAADLRADHAKCTLAFWHEPRFSSGGHGNHIEYTQFWRDLFDARADIVLNGHDHDYERFAPQTPMGRADPRGIREFVVGTGGKDLRSFHIIKANSQVRAASFGVLELRLRPAGYSWQFAPIAGSSFHDSGSGRCQ